MADGRGQRLGDRDALRACKVVITMPAYNAAATVARTVADIPQGVADRLILVDDASPDDTAAIARELGLDVHVHSENRGYGANQKTCYTMALQDGADVVVMLHPDYQYEPKAVPLLIAPILAGDADMTFGSRFAGLGDPRAGGMPLHRFLGNRVTTAVENVLLGSRFTEMHSGMRAFTRRCLLSLPFLRYADDFVFDSQLLIDAVTTGQRVVEVPIPTRYTEESSSIGAMASLSYVSRSLAYCARRVWRHGRKRGRSPIGRSNGIPRLPPSRSSPSLDDALTALAGYAHAGDRLLVVGSSSSDVRIADAGWRPVADHERADAVAVLTAPAEAAPFVDELARLAGRLAPEGMLVVAASDPRPLDPVLRTAGYELVEWRGAGARRPGFGVALARRISREGTS